MKRFLITLSAALITLSCGSGTSGIQEKETAFPAGSAAPVMAESAARSAPTPQSAESGGAGSLKPLDDLQTGRKKIVRGYLDLEVKDVEKAEKDITDKTAAAGGYVVSSELYMGSITLVLRVPAEKFDSFLESSEKLGRVRSRSVSTDDVTESYYDLEARIKNKEILRERFREYLKQASSIKDIMTVERQLNDVTGEIERLEGSFKRLERDINYSTLTVNLYPPVSEEESGNVPSFLKAFATLKYKIISFMYYLFFTFVYLIIFGVPVVLFAGLVFFIGWGRLGLIRKFFRKLKK